MLWVIRTRCEETFGPERVSYAFEYREHFYPLLPDDARVANLADTPSRQLRASDAGRIDVGRCDVRKEHQDGLGLHRCDQRPAAVR